jgi:hypothetical protein
MRATLYIPNQPPQIVVADLANMLSGGNYAQVSSEVATLLGCALNLVDVLDQGPDYVIYSVFDYEGVVNRDAMVALAELSQYLFDSTDEDQIIQGPVLVVTGIMLPT